MIHVLVNGDEKRLIQLAFNFFQGLKQPEYQFINS